MTAVTFILGSMIGGLVAIGFMCCLQLDRNNSHTENKE